jgi:hypothetical protein
MSTGTKTTVEECHALDVWVLRRAGYLEPGPMRRRLDLKRDGSYLATLNLMVVQGGLRLEYDVYSGWGTIVKESSFVGLVRTPAINQGERLWFSCPGCHKRVQKLYLPPGRTPSCAAAATTSPIAADRSGPTSSGSGEKSRLSCGRICSIPAWE